jgi:protein-tyrosine phosphatase
MNRLCDLIYLSDANEARDIDLLHKHGIQAVCNLTPETDNLNRDEFVVLRLDQQDGQPIPEHVIGRFLEWMHERMVASQRTLIHCAAGVSRTGAFAVAWLMACGFDWAEAEQEVNRKRLIQPHQALKDSVLAYFRGRGRAL